MTLNSLKNRIKNNIYNAPGWRTNRKIIVIESDDWGSIRMKSNKAFDKLSKKINISGNHYNKIDCLETDDDLVEIYNCLSLFKDFKGKHPNITTNFVMANPDFEKIRDNNYQKYHYDTFPQSYQKYYPSNKTFALLKEGIKNRLIFPQFHGREHLQVEYWMRDLEKKKKETLAAFNFDFFGFGKYELDSQGYLAAFNGISASDLEPIKIRIKNGLEIFKDIFGYDSCSIIPPQNTMHGNLLPFLKEQGVATLQGSRIRRQYPIYEGEKTKNKRFMGTTNAYGQLNIVRNVTFEPSSSNIPWVDKCLKEIAIAFFWKKPVVICSHRVNYMGFLDNKNRKSSLLQLKKLLQKIQKKWPDIEFLTTAELADTIRINHMQRNE